MSNHEHLYDVPIEALDLSVDAIHALKRTGVTSVGDCLDHFERMGDAMITVLPGFLKAMHGEVEQQLKKIGYWKLLSQEVRDSLNNTQEVSQDEHNKD